MKKIAAFLLTLLLCVSIPLALHAAAEEPYFEPVKATVSNKNGATVYDYIDYERPDPVAVPQGKTLPKGTTVTLVGEEPLGSVTYYRYADGDDFYLLSEKDLLFQLRSVAPQEENRYDPPQHFVVLNAQGLELLDGPGTLYPSLGKVPKGAVVTATHADALDKDPYDEETLFSVWSYVTYNGQSGWLSTNEYSADCGRSVKYRDVAQPPLGRLTTLESVPIFAAPNLLYEEDAKPVAVVPADTELTFEIYCMNEALVTYQGKQGWISMGKSDRQSVMAAFDGALMTTTEIPLYTAPDADEKNLTGKKTDAFALLPFDYTFTKDVQGSYDMPWENWYRVTVDGRQLWIHRPPDTAFDDYILEFYEGDAFRLPQGNRLPLTMKPYGGERILTMDGGAEFYWLLRYDNWDFVKFGDEYGWTQFDENAGYLPGRTLYSLFYAAPPEEPAAPEETTADASAPVTGASETKAAADKTATTVPYDPTPADRPDLFSTSNLVFFACAAGLIVLAIIGIRAAKKHDGSHPDS